MVLFEVATVVNTCGDSCSAGYPDPPAGTAVTVDIHDNAFYPSSVTVHVGQTVAWKFDDGGRFHNVTSENFISPDRTRGYYGFPMSLPGFYAYRCTLHRNMTGQVIVTGEPDTVP